MCPSNPLHPHSHVGPQVGPKPLSISPYFQLYLRIGALIYIEMSNLPCRAGTARLHLGTTRGPSYYVPALNAGPLAQHGPCLFRAGLCLASMATVPPVSIGPLTYFYSHFGFMLKYKKLKLTHQEKNDTHI